MSKSDSCPKKASGNNSTSPLPLLFAMLEKLQGLLDEQQNQQLLADIAAFTPEPERRAPCAGRAAPDVESSVSPLSENGPLPAPAKTVAGPNESGPNMADLADAASVFARNGYSDEDVAEIMESFLALQERYPLRAAALYLRVLCRIWAEAVEEGKQEIMADDQFIRSYIDVIRRVEAIATRCKLCVLEEDVCLQ